jgi:hypothetical protein
MRKRPLGRPRYTWEDNIKTDLKEIGCADIDWNNLAHDRFQLRAVVNTVVNAEFYKRRVIT